MFQEELVEIYPKDFLLREYPREALHFLKNPWKKFWKKDGGFSARNLGWFKDQIPG